MLRQTKENLKGKKRKFFEGGSMKEAVKWKRYESADRKFKNIERWKEVKKFKKRWREVEKW